MDLLSCSENDFDAVIKQLDMKGLIQTVSELQKEMAREQQKFNDVTQQLPTVPPGSGKHREMSKTLVFSQNRLTQLMARNMKCFNQQTTNQQKENAKMKERENSTSKQKTSPKQMFTIQTKVRSVSDPVRPTSNTSQMTQPDQRKSYHGNKCNNNYEIKPTMSEKTEDVSVSEPVKLTKYNKENTSVVTPPTNTNTLNGGDVTGEMFTGEINEPRKNDSAMHVNIQPSEVVIETNNNRDKAPQDEPDGSKFIIIIDKEDEINADEVNSEEDLDDRFVISSDKTLDYSSELSDSDIVEYTVTASPANSCSSQKSLHSSNKTDSKNIPDSLTSRQRDTPVQNAQVEAVNPSSLAINEKSDEPEKISHYQPVEVNVNIVDLSTENSKADDAKTESVKNSSGGIVKDQREVIPVNNQVKVVEEDIVVPIRLSPRESARPLFTKIFDSIYVNEESSVSTFKPKEKKKSPVAIDLRLKQAEKSADCAETRKKTATTVILSSPSHHYRPTEHSNLKKESPKGSDKYQSSAVIKSKKKSSPSPVAAVSDLKMGNHFGVTVQSGDNQKEDDTKDEYGHDGSEKVKPRVTMKSWDPTKLLKELYSLGYGQEVNEGEGPHYINMEGYLEKLPINKKKATLLKAWKRRYFKVENGCLYYYDNIHHKDRPSAMFQLGGGQVTELGPRTLGIDDGRGHYLMLRCPSEQEYNGWHQALESQIVHDSRGRYVKPAIMANPHPDRNVVIIDLGSRSVRAGLLCDKPSMPQVFFPNIAAINKETDEVVYGMLAWKPEIREKSQLVYPVKSSKTVDKFNIDMSLMPGLLEHIFKMLDVDPVQFWVMVSTPQNLSTKMKQDLVNMLIEEFSVCGVKLENQALLSLYSYNMQSGVVVDIGDRLEIVPVTEGYIVEGGVARQSYGGTAVAESLNKTLTELKYSYFTDVEQLLVRHIMEKSCYVASDFKEELNQYNEDPASFQETVDLSAFDLPQGCHKYVRTDLGRFKSSEGLLNTEVWGLDSPSLPKLLHAAIQACPMDSRREMCRSICLSGGTTLLPGFVERLRSQISQMVTSSVTVQIHASPYRYHSAYIGACILANLPIFHDVCISQKEWRDNGAKSIQKWP